MSSPSTAASQRGAAGPTQGPDAQRRSALGAGMKQDPWSVLGVSPDANDDQIRAAYVRKVKEFPPDRCGREFETIRDAYEQLKDPYGRAKYLILGAAADRPLESLLDGVPCLRHHAGLEPWLAAMKSTHEEQHK